MKNTVKGMFAGAAITAALALTAGTAKADPGWVYGDLNDHDGAAFAMTLAHDGDRDCGRARSWTRDTQGTRWCGPTSPPTR